MRQLFIARREAYEKCGGHAAIASSLHDGITLPRAFRRAGFRTDLFDATDTITCRMYASAAQVWSGLAKNATEGMASPHLIVPMTLVLLGGQLLPWMLLSPALRIGQRWPSRSRLMPRVLGAIVLSNPGSEFCSDPLSVALLVTIQWQAFIRGASAGVRSGRGRAAPRLDGVAG